jgi:hypothetical protein
MEEVVNTDSLFFSLLCLLSFLSTGLTVQECWYGEWTSSSASRNCNAW